MRTHGAAGAARGWGGPTLSGEALEALEVGWRWAGGGLEVVWLWCGWGVAVVWLWCGCGVAV